jgi:hypothetical protein
MALYTPFVQQNVQNLVAAKQQGQIKGLARSAYLGDPSAMRELYGVAPDVANQIRTQKMQEKQNQLSLQTQQAERIQAIAKQTANMTYEDARDYSSRIAAQYGIQAPVMTEDAHRQIQAAYADTAGGDTAAIEEMKFIMEKGGFTKQEVEDFMKVKARIKAGAVGSADLTATELGEDVVEDLAKTKEILAFGSKKGEMTAKDRSDVMNQAVTNIFNANTMISQLDEGIGLLDQGAGTGRIERMWPSFKASTIALENLQKQMGLTIIGAVTFGGLSANEMQIALDTAFPTDLDDDDLREWFVTKKSGQQKLKAFFEEQLAWLKDNPNKHPSDFYLMKTEQAAKDLPEGITEDQVAEIIKKRPNMTRAQIIEALSN